MKSYHCIYFDSTVAGTPHQTPPTGTLLRTLQIEGCNPSAYAHVYGCVRDWPDLWLAQSGLCHCIALLDGLMCGNQTTGPTSPPLPHNVLANPPSSPWQFRIPSMCRTIFREAPYYLPTKTGGMPADQSSSMWPDPVGDGLLR
ncbi:hypothetical protein FKP32DRAFT_1196004 [Trametes sanguinea]|nr:hypothetical protein FKP32DRAFT_1196004 [Trametes sanguinea]